MSSNLNPFEAVLAEDTVRVSGRPNGKWPDGRLVTVEEAVGAMALRLAESINKKLNLDGDAAVDAKSWSQKVRYFPDIDSKTPIQMVPSLLILFTDDKPRISLNAASLQTKVDVVSKQKEDIMHINSKFVEKINALEKRFESTTKDRQRKHDNEMQEMKATLNELQREMKSMQKESDTQAQAIRDLKATVEKLEKQKFAMQQEIREGQKICQKQQQTITEIVARMMPLNLRVLLDLARVRVAQIVNCREWDDLSEGQTQGQLVAFLAGQPALKHNQYSLSKEVIEFLCALNGVRRQANFIAHTATKEEVREAVLARPEGKEREHLTSLFAFSYNEPL